MAEDLHPVCAAQGNGNPGQRVRIGSFWYELGGRVLYGDLLAFGQDGRVYSIRELSMRQDGEQFDRCVHCGQRLIPTEDGDDVCKFCVPQFGKRRGKGELYSPRCPACSEGRPHSVEDLEISAERGKAAVS